MTAYYVIVISQTACSFDAIGETFQFLDHDHVMVDEFVLLFLCADMDECSLSVEICDQICNNTIGSFECKCNPGFILGIDRQSCFGKKHLIKYLYTLQNQVPL